MLLRLAAVALLGTVLLAAPALAAELPATGWGYDYDPTATVAVASQKPPGATRTPLATPGTRAFRGDGAAGEVSRSRTSVAGVSRAAKGADEFIGPVRQSSSQIANGHAFRKHIVERGEFPGISTPDQFARRIEGVVTNPTASKGLSRGREAFYDARSNTVVIRDPRSAVAGCWDGVPASRWPAVLRRAAVMRMIIDHVDGEARTVRGVLGEDELALIANALNEVCNGVEIEDFEFSTRLGVERSEAQELLAQVGAALDALSARS